MCRVQGSGFGFRMQVEVSITDTATFRGGLVFKAHRLCVSLNSRPESNKEKERPGAGTRLAPACSPGRLFVLFPGISEFPPGRILHGREREFFIDNLLARIHFIIVMIRWTGLAPWDLNSLFQVALHLPPCAASTLGIEALGARL